MATSGSKSVKVSTYDTLKFSWNVTSQSIADNTSTVAWKLQLVTTGAGKINSTQDKSYTIKVNGKSYTGTNKIGIGNNETKTLVSNSTVIEHNADGTKSFSYSFSQEFDVDLSGSHVDTISGSGSGTLNTIPRAATITAAPNFTDEDNPTITYSNPAGEAVSVLQAGISFDGETDNIAYRDVGITDTSYTFEFTEEEREMLRAVTVDTSSMEVQFCLKTVIGTNTFYNYLTKTLTIVNCEPVLSATVVDVNPVTLALTGDENVFIKYNSNAQYTIEATALKGASIVRQSVIVGSKSDTETSGIINGIDSGEFVFSVTDSRGYTATQTISRTLIDYRIPTCNLNVAAPSVEGDVPLTVSGSCYNGIIGDADIMNVINVEYRYKQNNDSYTEWIAVDNVSLNGNIYSTTVNVSGLDYRNAYTFQARVVDKLNTIISAAQTVKTTPVFDWSENDFNFNVPVNINGNLTINNSPLMVTIFDMVYPIGKVIHTTRAENPAEYLGRGTWEQIKDVFLLAAGDTYEAGTTGGEAEHALTINEMPSHDHAAYKYTGVDNDWSFLTAKRAAVSRRQVASSSSSGLYAVTTDSGQAYSNLDWPYVTAKKGDGAAHNNMPPYKTVYVWERVPDPIPVSYEQFTDKDGSVYFDAEASNFMTRVVE